MIEISQLVFGLSFTRRMAAKDLEKELPSSEEDVFTKRHRQRAGGSYLPVPISERFLDDRTIVKERLA
jgi:hypothetical protein